jgi:acid phosphatase (class A)
MRRHALLSLAFLVLAAGPALALSAAPYLKPGDVDLMHLLPPPPALNSADERRDLDYLLTVQRARTPAALMRAESDGAVTIYRFADGLGSDFTQDKLPAFDAFIVKVMGEEAGPLNMAKNFWHRPRPFEREAALAPPEDLKQGVANLQPPGAQGPVTYIFSYPSGHATFGALMAILLADMVPEKRTELFARGWEYGENRVVGGVHYQTDVDAGRIDAAVIAAALMRDAVFRADFAEAKSELRWVLNLPR